MQKFLVKIAITHQNNHNLQTAILYYVKTRNSLMYIKVPILTTLIYVQTSCLGYIPNSVSQSCHKNSNF